MGQDRRQLGRTALITGAAGGIGQELARCFARDGYELDTRNNRGFGDVIGRGAG